MDSFGSRLKAARKLAPPPKGKTGRGAGELGCNELDRLAGVSVGMTSRYENNERARPEREKVRRRVSLMGY